MVVLIRAARQRAAQAVNAELITLYWRIGQYLHRKIEADGWAKGTVLGLAAFIARHEPGLRGFSAQNLWRMRQFFVAYPSEEKLSTLARKLPWSAHLHILSRTKRDEARQFYLRMPVQQRSPVRELARQIDSGLFERAVLNLPKLSTALRESQPQAQQHRWIGAAVGTAHGLTPSVPTPSAPSATAAPHPCTTAAPARRA